MFDPGVEPLPRRPLWNGKVQGIGGPRPDFGESGIEPFAITLDAGTPYRDALALIRERVLARLGSRRVGVVAHRVVHGGSRYFEPVRVDAGVLDNLRGYILGAAAQPSRGSVGSCCSNTRSCRSGLLRHRFHTPSHGRTDPPLPGRLETWLATASWTVYPTWRPAARRTYSARGRTIVAHSAVAPPCAISGPESVATTMGSPHWTA